MSRLRLARRKPPRGLRGLLLRGPCCTCVRWLRCVAWLCGMQGEAATWPAQGHLQVGYRFTQGRGGGGGGGQGSGCLGGIRCRPPAPVRPLSVSHGSRRSSSWCTAGTTGTCSAARWGHAAASARWTPTLGTFRTELVHIPPSHPSHTPFPLQHPPLLTRYQVSFVVTFVTFRCTVVTFNF